MLALSGFEPFMLFWRMGLVSALVRANFSPYLDLWSLLGLIQSLYSYLRAQPVSYPPLLMC